MLKIYGTEWCSKSKQLKSILEKDGIPYMFIDIEACVLAHKILISKRLETIPQTFRDDTWIGDYEDTLHYLDKGSDGSK